MEILAGMQAAANWMPVIARKNGVTHDNIRLSRTTVRNSICQQSLSNRSSGSSNSREPLSTYCRCTKIGRFLPSALSTLINAWKIQNSSCLRFCLGCALTRNSVTCQRSSLRRIRQRTCTFCSAVSVALPSFCCNVMRTGSGCTGMRFHTGCCKGSPFLSVCV